MVWMAVEGGNVVKATTDCVQQLLPRDIEGELGSPCMSCFLGEEGSSVTIAALPQPQSRRWEARSLPLMGVELVTRVENVMVVTVEVVDESRVEWNVGAAGTKP